MNYESSSLRRAHVNTNIGEATPLPSSYDAPLATTDIMRRRKGKNKKSIMPLSCQRAFVRFVTLQKTSQLVLVLMVISFIFLLPPTIYLMRSPSRYILDKNEIYQSKSQKRREGDGQKTKHLPIKDSQFVNVDFNQNFANVTKEHESERNIYDIKNNKLLKEFIERKTFPSLEPRVVKLTDRDHSFQFQVAPGSSSSLTLPEKGSKTLKSKYIPIQADSLKQLNPADPLGKGDCKPIAPDWQLAYHPTCNQIHELSGGWQQTYRLPAGFSSRNKSSDLESFQLGATLDDEAIAPDVHHREQTRLVNQGAFRHVWMIRDSHDGITKRAMKTLRSLKRKEKKFDLRNHDRHRRDAMSFEQLHNSSLVVDLYASCSNTAIFDYADRGDLRRIFESEEEESQTFNLHLMEIAYNVSLSVHDAHHFDEEGRATMAHTDIKVNQFIYQDGYYKLSDFNRVRFLTWNNKVNKGCGFDVAKNGGEYRSPEEYAYEKETEKVDVYSLGNVLYFLLMRHEVWVEKPVKQVYELVKLGHRPKIPEKIYNSKGIFERAMVRAIEMAWVQEPEGRSSALEVAKVIKEGLDMLSEGAKNYHR